MSKKHPNKLTKTNDEKMPKSLIVMIVIFAALIIGWIFGGVPYTLKYMECGEAPATVSPGIVGASTRPELPGEEGYGPGLLKEYVCVKDTYLK